MLKTALAWIKANPKASATYAAGAASVISYALGAAGVAAPTWLTVVYHAVQGAAQLAGVVAPGQ